MSEPTARLLNSEVRKYLEGKERITPKDLSNLEKEVENRLRFRNNQREDNAYYAFAQGT